MLTRRSYRSHFFQVVALATAGSLISGCGPGQFLGPTVTPSPTNTPVPTATSTPTAIPTPLGGGSRIAFVSDRSGKWEPYQMNSDGSQPKRLTTAQLSQDYFPVTASGGTMDLYASHVTKLVSIEGDWLKSHGSRATLFANAAIVDAARSPDGKTVAVSIFFLNGQADIYAFPTKGGPLVQLTTSPAIDYEAAWSPDGKTIAFVSRRDGTPHLYLMGVDGKNQRRLTTSEDPEVEPAWSPDGSRIAITDWDTRKGSSNIYIVRSDGTELVKITLETNTLNENPVWSPDGKMIAFWSDRTGDHEIFVMQPDGSGVINLTNNARQDESPIWLK